MTGPKGYTLLILLLAVSVLSIGLLIAVPVWQTQMKREKEEELIFRGKQYVEAIRLFQIKYPGSFPRSLEELLEEKCIRKLYQDPMTKDGKWNVILPYRGVSVKKGTSPQKVLIAPLNALSSIENPQIIGVVSSSEKKSVKHYLGQETYDRWLFFYGQDPKKMPEIFVYGQSREESEHIQANNLF
ncbi:MAG: hypothetical protein ACE5LC_07390 [Candidatus Aminicenantales bacterium]